MQQLPTTVTEHDTGTAKSKQLEFSKTFHKVIFSTVAVPCQKSRKRMLLTETKWSKTIGKAIKTSSEYPLVIDHLRNFWQGLVSSTHFLILTKEDYTIVIFWGASLSEFMPQSNMGSLSPSEW